MDGRYRRRYNFELERDFADANVVATVKLNRLRWNWREASSLRPAALDPAKSKKWM